MTVLCTEARRDVTLDALRDLGVLHLSHIRAPGGETVEKARAHQQYVARVLEVLPKKAAVRPSGRPAAEIVENIWDLIHRRQALTEALAALKYERDRIAPFGSFDPESVARLARSGIQVRLYQAGPKQAVEAPEGAVLHLLRSDNTGRYFAVISRAPVEVAAREVRLPVLSLDDLQREMDDTAAALADCGTQFEAYAGDHAAVAAIVAEADDALRYAEARAGMGASAPVSYLRGYCPADAVARIRHAAAQGGWGLIVEDPEPGEVVPTLIRNPRWLRPIETIYEAFGILPGYEEVDVSAVFLVFLSVFFAMIVGDAGYGAVFLGLTLWARKKFPNGPARAFSFMKIMSVCTIIWGVMTGSYFFIPVLPTVFTRMKVAWLSDEDHVKHLAFLLGAIHLTIAHAWSAARMLNSPKAIAQAGWIAVTWTMFFAAGTMVLGRPFPGWVGPVGAAGVLAVVLFMTPIRDFKNEWFNHVLLPLTIVSNFIDIVSYIRLYAVGVAGAAIATSFASMALSGVDSLGSGLVAAAILFAAHALNIVLSALGVLVHGVRLNVLEFTNHIGMQWSGSAYQPFARRPRANAAGSG
jgi:V/A-type H+-transporting ATPase subunit I